MTVLLARRSVQQYFQDFQGSSEPCRVARHLRYLDSRPDFCNGVSIQLGSIVDRRQHCLGIAAVGEPIVLLPDQSYAL